METDLTHDALGVLSGHKVDGSLSAVEPDGPPEVTLHLSDADGEVAEDAGAVTVTATVSPASATVFAPSGHRTVKRGAEPRPRRVRATADDRGGVGKPWTPGGGAAGTRTPTETRPAARLPD